MSVVRTTFQHACAATREVLRNNPKLIAEGQEQLLPGAPWGPISCEEPHYWHGMCDIHCEVHLPKRVHAAIQQQGVWPHPPKSQEAQVFPEEIAVFWNFTQKEWDEIPNDRRKKALMSISQRTDVPKSFNPKSPVWNESVSGLTRLQKVADKVWSFTDAELDHANGGDPTRLSKDEKHAMAASSACSQLLQVADENIPKSDKEEQDESWRQIKIQRLHYIEYAKLLDRFAPGTIYENGPQRLGIDRHFWRALDENRQLRDSILAENGDDGSQLVFNQECTSEEDEQWSDEGPWSTEQTQLWNDVHGDDKAYWREWEQILEKRRWAKESAAHVKYKAERLRRFLSIDPDKISSFEATHYNYLAGRVQDAVAAVHSYHHLCLVPTVLVDDGAAWRLDLVEQKIQSVCVLADQELSEWTKQFTGKSSVMPTPTANAIKHLSRAPGSGHNNQRHLDTLMPWLKLIGLDQVLLAILTGNLRVTVSHKTKMTQIALQQCRDICNRHYKVLPTEMEISRQQLQYERDFCVKDPTVLLVDLNKLASMLHLAYREFYFNLSDAEQKYHQKVRTPESLLAHLDMYVLVSPAPDQGKYEHRQKLRKSVLARKRPTASIRDWMAEFYANVANYERDTRELYFPDPTPDERRVADEQSPKVVDSETQGGGTEYDIYTEGRAHIITDTLVDDTHWRELRFALEKKERKNGPPKSLAAFWNLLIELSDKIQRDHAQNALLAKSAKDAQAAAIREGVVAELHALGIPRVQKKFGAAVQQNSRAYAEQCVFCGSTDCSLCTVCFLKCDGKVNGSHTAENCHYLNRKGDGGQRQTEIQQNALYDGTCPYCFTDEMFDAKSVPPSVKHSPLGCRLRTSGRAPNMQCRMTMRGMQTSWRSDKPKKASFKSRWHDKKLKQRYGTKGNGPKGAVKGAGRGRGNPYGSSLRGRARGGLKGRGSGRGAATAAAAQAADGEDTDGLDSQQGSGKKKPKAAKKKKKKEAAVAVAAAGEEKKKKKRKRRGKNNRNGKKKDDHGRAKRRRSGHRFSTCRLGCGCGGHHR